MIYTRSEDFLRFRTKTEKIKTSGAIWLADTPSVSDLIWDVGSRSDGCCSSSSLELFSPVNGGDGQNCCRWRRRSGVPPALATASNGGDGLGEHVGTLGPPPPRSNRRRRELRCGSNGGGGGGGFELEIELVSRLGFVIFVGTESHGSGVFMGGVSWARGKRSNGNRRFRL